MKKYLYLIVFVMIFVKINTANSQTFPDINNDTTYLRKITFKEGAREDMPIYIDTTGLNGFQLKHLLGGYKERYYSKYGITIHLNSKYFFNNEANSDSLNYNTQNTELIQIFDSLKNRFGNFNFADKYETGSDTNKGRDLYLIFVNHINSMSVSKFLGSKIGNALRTTGYDNFPELPVNSIEKDIDKINIYPNPTQSEKIILDFDEERVADLVIYDFIGNKIKTIPNYTNKSEIDVSELPKGTYILKYNSQSEKFIKE